MKRIVFALFYFLISSSVFAQTDIEFLQRTKEYINTKYTALILNSSLPRIDKEASRNITRILKKNSLEQPFSYEEIETLVKGKFDSSILNFTSRVDQINITDLSALRPEEAIERLNDEAYYISREIFNTLISPQLKKSIYEETASQLDTATDERSHTALNTNGEVKKPVEYHLPGGTNSSWMFIALVVAIVVITYSFIRIFRLKARLADARLTISNLQANKKDEKGKLLPVYNEFRTLVTSKLKEYEENLLKLQEKIKEQNIELKKEERQKGQSSNNTAQKEDKVLYMGAPSGNCFPVNVQTESNHNAFYKLILKEGGQEANFEVNNDGPSLSEAIAHYSFYFEPACFATNKPTADTKKVITSFPGVVSLQGDKWMIKQKAIIVFA